MRRGETPPTAPFEVLLSRARLLIQSVSIAPNVAEEVPEIQISETTSPTASDATVVTTDEASAVQSVDATTVIPGEIRTAQFTTAEEPDEIEALVVAEILAVIIIILELDEVPVVI